VDDKNWLQNTDGCDTYRSHNVTFGEFSCQLLYLWVGISLMIRVENFVYQGGDDCLAFKPNSTMITARNVSCYGGTGIAFGSIAQYEGAVCFPSPYSINADSSLHSVRHH